jgi:hypothetical protein
VSGVELASLVRARNANIDLAYGSLATSVTRHALAADMTGPRSAGPFFREAESSTLKDVQSYWSQRRSRSRCQIASTRFRLALPLKSSDHEGENAGCGESRADVSCAVAGEQSKYLRCWLQKPVRMTAEIMTGSRHTAQTDLAGRTFGALLFDMDGTILSSIKAAERVWAIWAKRHGLDVASFLPTIHGFRTVETIRRLGLPGVDPEAEAAAITQAEIEDVEGIEQIAGAATFLSALPADRWAIVTSVHDFA